VCVWEAPHATFSSSLPQAMICSSEGSTDAVVLGSLPASSGATDTHRSQAWGGRPQHIGTNIKQTLHHQANTITG
jgi:hypothetical protein